jgi:hypothetical protein
LLGALPDLFENTRGLCLGRGGCNYATKAVTAPVGQSVRELFNGDEMFF